MRFRWKSLHRNWGLHYLRVGDYRILYTVEEEIITVRVTDAGNRGDIYK